MAQARSARAINSRGKKRGSATYSMDRKYEVSKVFIISLLSDEFGNHSTHEERLQISEAGRTQRGSI